MSVSSVRWYLRYLLSGFNRNRMFLRHIEAPRVSDFEYRLLDLRPMPIVTDKNTLLVSDNIGFHRRGKLSPGRKRIQVNFLFHKDRVSYLSQGALRVLKVSAVVFSVLQSFWKVFQSFSKQHSDSRKLHNGISLFRSDNANDARFDYVFDSNEQSNHEYILFKKAAEISQYIFDMGANYGMFTFGLYPLAPEKVVHTFEPNPTLYSSLTTTVASNRLSTCQFNINNLGVSDTNSTLPFGINGEWSGSSSFLGSSPSSGNASVDVKVVTLDSYVDEHQIPIDQKAVLLKIDVEGFDLKALTGAKGLLQRCSDYLVIIELNGEQFANDAASVEFFETLYEKSSLRYAVFTDGVVELSALEDLRGFFNRSSDHIDVVLASSGFASIFGE